MRGRLLFAVVVAVAVNVVAAVALAAVAVVVAAAVPWFVTLAVLGVTVLLVSRARRLRAGRRSRIAAGWAGAIGVGLVLASVPGAAAALDLRADVTANRRLTLSPATEQMLRSLRADVEVTGFFARGSGEALAFRDLLAVYRRQSDHIEVRLVDPDADPGLAQRFGLREYGTVFVDYAGRRTETNVVAEIELTSAILRAVRGGAKRVCALEGHGEHRFDDSTPRGYSGLGELLLGDNVELIPLDLARGVGELTTCRLVVAGGPTVDLLPGEIAALDRWLIDGGKLLAMVDPSSAADLGALLRRWGILPRPGVVLDPGRSLPEDPSTLLVRRFPSLSPVGRGLAQVVLPESGWVQVGGDEAGGLTTSAVATTGADPRVVGANAPLATPQALDNPIAVVAAADASRVTGTGRRAAIERTRVVWIGDSDFASNGFLDFVSNRQLVLNAVHWLLLDEDLISIGAPPIDFRQLLLTRAERDRLFFATVVATPAVVLVAGFAVRLVARRRERRPLPAADVS